MWNVECIANYRNWEVGEGFACLDRPNLAQDGKGVLKLRGVDIWGKSFSLPAAKFSLTFNRNG